MSQPWKTDIAPSSTLYPGEIPLYQRDCILLIDGADASDCGNDNDSTHSIIERLKDIRFDKWGTGPPQQRQHKNQSDCIVVEQLRDIPKGTESVFSPEQDYRYRTLQRYVWLFLIIHVDARILMKTYQRSLRCVLCRKA